MQLAYFPTTKTACVYQLGNATHHQATVWFLIHGFAQKADGFLLTFKPLLTDNILLVAPEALNKFYTKGGMGNVVATWMTKDNRENEIKDYIYYLNSLIEQYSKRGFTRFCILGFSQGATTASRWAANCTIPLEKLILYAGEPAPEIDLKKINSTKKIFIIGNQDPFFPEKTIAQFADRLADFSLLKFEGNHEINTEILATIFS